MMSSLQSTQTVLPISHYPVTPAKELKAGDAVLKGYPFGLTRLFDSDAIKQLVKVPQALLDLTTCSSLYHHAFPSAIFPATCEFTAIFGIKNTLAMHLVVLKLAFVALSVLPNHASSPTLFIVLPMPYISTLSVPVILTIAVQLVVQKFSLVETGSIFKIKLAIAVLRTPIPMSSEFLAIAKLFAALTKRKTFLPLSIVPEPICRYKLSFALGAVAVKFPHVFVTICINKSAHSMSITILPMTLVEGPVFPFQSAHSMPLSHHCLPSVDGAITVINLWCIYLWIQKNLGQV